jgi:hypothetical protein
MVEIAGQGSGKWAQPGVPHKGWRCVDIEDLGEPSATCEMCEAQEIRYVHHMEHPSYPLGAVACAPGTWTTTTKARGSGKRRCATPGRGVNAGLPVTGVRHATAIRSLMPTGYNIVVYRAGRAWGFRVTNRKSSEAVSSRLPLPSFDVAKLRAFDAMIWMKQRGQ